MRLPPVCSQKVGFDEIVSDNTGDLAALKTDSPKRKMDFGWTYSAPWGYALMERIVGGRGLSLKVRKPAATVPVGGAA